MKRSLILFFFLSIIFPSCEVYETDESIEIYRKNESEFINVFKIFSSQNEITSIDISKSPFEYGFMKFIIVPNRVNPKNTYLPNRIEINPNYSFNGKIEFDEEEIAFLTEHDLNVHEVLAACKLLSKFQCYGIDVMGRRDMYGPKTVRLELNPYQGYLYIPTGEDPFTIEGRDYVELSENIYYYTEL